MQNWKSCYTFDSEGRFFLTHYKTYAEPFLIQDFKFSLETLSDKIKKNYTDRRDR